MNFDIIQIIAMVISLIIAIVGHEIMHGLVAYKYGDSTAKNQDRLSINPIKHVDPIGTVIVPALLYITNAGFLFGWAKPVPVNMQTVIQNGGYWGAINVSLAGIAYNLALALIGALLIRNIPIDPNGFLVVFLIQLVAINIVLALFNLIPIPPLDGFNALSFLLAQLGLNSVSQKLFEFSRYGMILLILIIATPISRYIFAPIHYVIGLFLGIN